MPFETIRNADGSTTVLDVPIFPTCKRGEDEYDAGWLGRAFDRLREAESEGHLAPVHIYHHGSQREKPRHAGLMKPSRIGNLRWRGKDRQCIYCDLIITDGEALKRLSKRQLPYRSVELSDDNEDGAYEIVSLSLLDSEPPYVEMPMTFLDEGAGVPNETYTRLPRSGAPVLCFKRDGTRVTAYMEAGMPEIKKFMDDEEKKDEESAVAMQDSEEDREDYQDGGEESADEGESSGQSIADIDLGKCTGTPDEWAAFVSAAQDILASFSAGEEAVEDEVLDEEAPAEPSDNPPDVAMMQKHAATKAEAHAKQFALEQRIAKLEAEKERDAEIESALSDLDGIAFSGDPKARLRAEYDEGAKEGGHELGMFQLRHFAKIAKGGAYPAAPGQIVQGREPISDLPEDAQKACNGDPDHDEAVAKAYRAFQRTSGRFSKNTFQRFWSANQRAFLGNAAK